MTMPFSYGACKTYKKSEARAKAPQKSGAVISGTEHELGILHKNAQKNKQ